MPGKKESSMQTNYWRDKVELLIDDKKRWMKEMKDLRTKLKDILEKNTTLEGEIKSSKKIIAAYESNEMNFVGTQTLLEASHKVTDKKEEKPEAEYDLNATSMGNITNMQVSMLGGIPQT